MDPLYLLLAALIVALTFALTKLLSGKSRDTDKTLGAYTPSARPAAASTLEAANDATSIEMQVKALLAKGRRLEAIKLMRESNGLSLADARDAVEAIGQHGRPTLGEMGMMSTIRLAQQLGKEVHELVAGGQKVEAIRLVRDQTGLGLREAKELVDRLG